MAGATIVIILERSYVLPILSDFLKALHKTQKQKALKLLG